MGTLISGISLKCNNAVSLVIWEEHCRCTHCTEMPAIRHSVTCIHLVPSRIGKHTDLFVARYFIESFHRFHAIQNQ